jgi:Gpi18-like mannosyltransferase
MVLPEAFGDQQFCLNIAALDSHLAYWSMRHKLLLFPLMKGARQNICP